MWSRALTAAAALLVVVACGSSSGEPLAVEIQAEMGTARISPAVLSGPAVDEGTVCAAADTESVGYEDLDGNSLTEQEFMDITEVALETGEVTAGGIFVEFVCDDNTGSFVLKWQPSVAPSEFDYEAMNEDVGTWIVDSGTDAYGELSGEGSLDFDFADGYSVWTGELND